MLKSENVEDVGLEEDLERLQKFVLGLFVFLSISVVCYILDINGSGVLTIQIWTFFCQFFGKDPMKWFFWVCQSILGVCFCSHC
jgi:hypothetical protein